MSEKPACPECGASVPPNAPRGLCPRCLMGAAFSATGTYTPPSPTPGGGPPAAAPGRPRRVPPGDPGAGPGRPRGAGPPAEEASGEVARLARVLVRSGKLTAYQAGALAQGKGKGLVIGSYLVREKRGQGGMGVVFKAVHRQSGQVVGPQDPASPPSAATARPCSGSVASSRSPPGSTTRTSSRSLEADEDRGVQFLTMEYVEGHDLDDMVREVGPLPIKMSLHCAIQAARGLAAAHAQGIIHRDVKPGNLMLDPTGAVRVLDLGLARVIESTNPLGPVGRGRP